MVKYFVLNFTSMRLMVIIFHAKKSGNQVLKNHAQNRYFSQNDKK